MTESSHSARFGDENIYSLIENGIGARQYIAMYSEEDNIYIYIYMYMYVYIDLRSSALTIHRCRIIWSAFVELKPNLD